MTNQRLHGAPYGEHGVSSSPIHTWICVHAHDASASTPICRLTFYTLRIKDRLASKESSLCAKLGSWLIDLIQKFLPCTKLFTGNWLYCCCLVAKLCPTLCYPMDCSPAGSPVHAIFQVRILKWDAISFSRESSWPRDQTCISCTAGRFFTTELPGEPHWLYRRV